MICLEQQRFTSKKLWSVGSITVQFSVLILRIYINVEPCNKLKKPK